MADFTIYFVGLICHVGPDDGTYRKTHAAIIDDPSGVHEASILIPGEPVYPVKKYSSVTFAVTPPVNPGYASTSNLFRAIVPQLQKLTDGKILDDVRDHKPHVAVRAYVLFPNGGELDVAEAYPKQGKYTLNGAVVYEDCVARVTSLVIKGANSVDVNVAGVDIGPLSSNIPAFITNASSGGRHFYLHRFLTDAGHIADVEETSDCPLAKTGPHVELGVDESRAVVTQVECSNSQYP